MCGAGMAAATAGGRRVVVTGLGVLSPLGNGVQTAWKGASFSLLHHIMSHMACVGNSQDGHVVRFGVLTCCPVWCAAVCEGRSGVRALTAKDNIPKLEEMPSRVRHNGLLFNYPAQAVCGQSTPAASEFEKSTSC